MKFKIYLIGLFKISIFLLSVGFLLYILLNNYQTIKNNELFDRKYIIMEILILSILYAFVFVFVAIAWKSILENLSKSKLSVVLIWIWLKANIYKYLPGNIFHYAGRHILSKKMGINHKILIKSNIVEILLMLTTSLLISSSILLLIYDFNIDEYLSIINKNVIYGGLFIYGIILISLSKYKNINFLFYKNTIIYYCVFFVGIGFLAYIVLNYEMGIQCSFLMMTAIYTFAWLVGFVTPGAPGGIGVRESIFVVFSHGLLSISDALVLSMVLRISNIIGEIILFVIAERMLIKYNKELK